MSDNEPGPDDAIELLVAEATDEFIERVERGEEPGIDEYASRYPAVAGILRELLPAVRAMRHQGELPTDALGMLGDFRLVREIGRGGMGIVYEAEQISLLRRVALKVLPLAAALDPRQLQRFRLEAQAAAQLHHSHIVPVYSVGCERGVYYYAMQHIEGRSLAAVIADLAGGNDPRSNASLSRNGDADASALEILPAHAETINESRGKTQAGGGGRHFRRVAELGIQAAEALEHAHSMGVIHRDIKPANLLLDDRGSLYVADFGLARLQGDAGLTMTGALAGTLRYMSPEQVLSSRDLVDHRTDIYSLGVTLYELMTLTPAFDATERHLLLRDIAQQEPMVPSRHCKAVPTDLETIVLKAMAKEPAARYASARELADDLRRFLEHRTIAARRPTAWQRVAKWTRRHRGVAATAVAILVLLAVGLAISTALVTREQWKTRAAFNRLAAEQNRTEQALKAEAQQRDRAVQSQRQARQVVDFITEISEEELADKPELQGLRRVLLAAALQYYRDFIAQAADDPSLEAQLAASHLRIAGILDEIGSNDEALAALERARTLQEKLLRRNPTGLESQLALASIYRRFGALRGGRELHLLTQQSVQEELKLAPEQIRAIEEMSETRRRPHLEAHGLSEQQWREKFEELSAQQARVAQLLDESQTLRLRQIALQQRGSQAFADPEIAKLLAISTEQLEQMRAIRDETRRALTAEARGGDGHGDGAGGDRWKRARDAWRETNEKIQGVLTSEQRVKWQEMTGEPFKGKIRPAMWGSSRGRRGGGDSVSRKEATRPRQ